MSLYLRYITIRSGAGDNKKLLTEASSVLKKNGLIT